MVDADYPAGRNLRDVYHTSIESGLVLARNILDQGQVLRLADPQDIAHVPHTQSAIMV